MKIIESASIAPEVMPLTKPHTAALLWPSSGLPMSATPLMAITRLNNCSGVWRSPKKKKPMAERKKICRLLSRVEMPGPTA